MACDVPAKQLTFLPFFFKVLFVFLLVSFITEVESFQYFQIVSNLS